MIDGSKELNGIGRGWERLRRGQFTRQGDDVLGRNARPALYRGTSSSPLYRGTSPNPMPSGLASTLAEKSKLSGHHRRVSSKTVVKSWGEELNTLRHQRYRREGARNREHKKAEDLLERRARQIYQERVRHAHETTVTPQQAPKPAPSVKSRSIAEGGSRKGGSGRNAASAFYNTEKHIQDGVAFQTPIPLPVDTKVRNRARPKGGGIPSGYPHFSAGRPGTVPVVKSQATSHSSSERILPSPRMRKVPNEASKVKRETKRERREDDTMKTDKKKDKENEKKKNKKKKDLKKKNKAEPIPETPPEIPTLPIPPAVSAECSTSAQIRARDNTVSVASSHRLETSKQSIEPDPSLEVRDAEPIVEQFAASPSRGTTDEEVDSQAESEPDPFYRFVKNVYIEEGVFTRGEELTSSRQDLFALVEGMIPKLQQDGIQASIWVGNADHRSVELRLSPERDVLIIKSTKKTLELPISSLVHIASSSRVSGKGLIGRRMIQKGLTDEADLIRTLFIEFINTAGNVDTFLLSFSTGRDCESASRVLQLLQKWFETTSTSHRKK